MLEFKITIHYCAIVNRTELIGGRRLNDNRIENIYFISRNNLWSVLQLNIKLSIYFGYESLFVVYIFVFCIE